MGSNMGSKPSVGKCLKKDPRSRGAPESQPYIRTSQVVLQSRFKQFSSIYHQIPCAKHVRSIVRGDGGRVRFRLQGLTSAVATRRPAVKDIRGIARPDQNIYFPNPFSLNPEAPTRTVKQNLPDALQHQQKEKLLQWEECSWLPNTGNSRKPFNPRRSCNKMMTQNGPSTLNSASTKGSCASCARSSVISASCASTNMSMPETSETRHWHAHTCARTHTHRETHRDTHRQHACTHMSPAGGVVGVTPRA